jgi:hypothetical protein
VVGRIGEEHDPRHQAQQVLVAERLDHLPDLLEAFLVLVVAAVPRVAEDVEAVGVTRQRVPPACQPSGQPLPLRVESAT